MGQVPPEKRPRSCGEAVQSSPGGGGRAPRCRRPAATRPPPTAARARSERLPDFLGVDFEALDPMNNGLARPPPIWIQRLDASVQRIAYLRRRRLFGQPGAQFRIMRPETGEHVVPEQRHYRVLPLALALAVTLPNGFADADSVRLAEREPHAGAVA